MHVVRYAQVHPPGACVELCRECANAGRWAGKLADVQHGEHAGRCEDIQHGPGRTWTAGLGWQEDA